MNSNINAASQQHINDYGNASGPPTQFEASMQRTEHENASAIEVEGTELDHEAERRVPSELRSRPKIPRTPAEGEGRDLNFDASLNQRQDIEPIDDAIPKIKGQEVKDAA